jgi:hypothetical protein
VSPTRGSNRGVSACSPGPYAGPALCSPTLVRAASAARKASPAIARAARALYHSVRNLDVSLRPGRKGTVSGSVIMDEGTRFTPPARTLVGP